MNYTQIGILLLQGTMVSSLILLLFHLRNQLGIGILFACLGLFQFMQVFLSSTVYLHITENMLVSPGSTVMFTATLFAILLIYIKEDAIETRKIIYALVIANIAMSLLILTLSWTLKQTPSYNPYNVSANLFDNNAWVLLVGTAALFIDSILIIIIYEYLSRKIARLFWQISATMLIVISFDTLFYSLLALWKFENLETIILSGLVSKGAFALFYSIIFTLYLKFLASKELPKSTLQVKDVFLPLSYRQKYEVAKQDIIKTTEEAKEMGIKYQTLTNISPVGIFHTRSDGYTTYTNPKWSEISGIPTEEAVGFGWLKAVHPDDVEPIQQGWAEATSHKRESETQYRFLWNNGSIRWVLGKAVPELNEQRDIIGYVGTITDITEIKLFQQEQIRLKELAQQSDRLKSAFLANISHEIRTPMNGILGFADLLNEPGLTDQEQQEYIQVIKSSSNRMLNIIHDIVNISKIESGMTEIDLADTNINDVLHCAHDIMQAEAKKKNLSLSINCTLPQNEAIIKTDSEKLTIIIANLLKNAIKYTNSGTIDIGYTKRDKEFEFYIKDTGIGIPQQEIETIFDRFTKAEASYKTGNQGAGLGLSISKAYIKMLGGKIWAESEVNKGSIFYFTLPCCIPRIN